MSYVNVLIAVWRRISNVKALLLFIEQRGLFFILILLGLHLHQQII